MLDETKCEHRLEIPVAGGDHPMCRQDDALDTQ